MATFDFPASPNDNDTYSLNGVTYKYVAAKQRWEIVPTPHNFETTAQLDIRDTSNRDRTNHTGTQAAATITDFDTEVSNNTDVAANTSARHDAVTVVDSSEIDFTLTGQQITASIIAGSIDESKLDASVNASLDLADTALQAGDPLTDLSSGDAVDGQVPIADGLGGIAWEDSSGGWDGTTAIDVTANGAASTPPVTLSGTWFTGGTTTTTTPQFLIQPTGTTSTNWNVAGTGLGVNAPSGFTGNLLDLQVDGVSRLKYNVANKTLKLHDDGTRGGLSIGKGAFDASITGINGVWLEIGGFSAGVRFNNMPITLGSNRTTVIEQNKLTFTSYPGVNSQIIGGQRLNFPNENPVKFIIKPHPRGSGGETPTYPYGGDLLLSGGEAFTTATNAANGGHLYLDGGKSYGTGVDGSVKVGANHGVLEIAGAMTVATLPSSPAIGMIARVTDADTPSSGSTVTGGGASNALVWYNGTNWTVLGV